MADLVARRVEAMERAIGPFLAAMMAPHAQRRVAGAAADFMAGNPQELALPGFVAALARWSVPQDKDWFAYTMMDPRAQEAAARGLGARLGLAFDAADIILARGASGGLALSLHTIVDPGDEVLFVSPPWFFYEAMILAAGATPVRVRVDPAASGTAWWPRCATSAMRYMSRRAPSTSCRARRSRTTWRSRRRWPAAMSSCCRAGPWRCRGTSASR